MTKQTAQTAAVAPEKLLPMLRESNEAVSCIERQVQAINDILFGNRRETADEPVADSARGMALYELAALQRINDALTAIIEALA